MPALYNIGRTKVENKEEKRSSENQATNKNFRDFLGSLVLMIPTEVVVLYFVGKGFAEDSPIISLGIWAVICWLVVIPSRLWGMTEQPGERYGNNTKWINLIISLIAFPTWVLALGGPIFTFSLDTNTASLLVLMISVIGGWFYTNPD